MPNDRRAFLKLTALTGLAMTLKPNLSYSYSNDLIIGHGDFKYKVDPSWGNLDPAKTPVQNCHEMVMDKKGRLFMVTDEPKNNIIIYNQSGRLLSTWTLNLPAAHGLSMVNEGGEEFLWILDNSGFVTILDENNKVVSNPGGTEPRYLDGELQLMVQKEPVFKHCHDVCIDQDENLYVCQWNASKTYPIKLNRI